MKSMPKGMILYFPIVLMPEKTIVSYKAEFVNGQSTVKSDEITILYNSRVLL